VTPSAAAPVEQALPAGGALRRVLSWFAVHRRAQLAVLLAPPVGWMAVVYFGSLALLLVAAFWYLDPASNTIVRSFTLRNFADLASQPVYRTIVLRTVTVAAVVTIVDAVVAFPIAWYMARIASPRTRAVLFMAVLLPLWASYLVRVYAWRVILSQNGFLDSALSSVGLGGIADVFGVSDISMTVVFCYLWLPYMILPVYAGLERIPGSLLEASADLGAHGRATFRRIVLPLALPAVVAGSIFTFSLTLGDYITPQLTSNSQFIGNVIFENVGVVGNVPFAAALSLVPIAIIGLYVLIARRMGAFEAL
jgi:putative spermidine/putrescine transport system permease protein